MQKEYFTQVVKTLMADTGLDQETSEELVTLFCKKREILMVEIKKAVQDNNQEELRKLVHQIKGSSGNIRAKDISLLALRVEEYLKSGQMQEAAKAVEEMDGLALALCNGK